MLNLEAKVEKQNIVKAVLGEDGSEGCEELVDIAYALTKYHEERQRLRGEMDTLGEKLEKAENGHGRWR